MSEIKIFHNPRCSKSRAALSLLEERGIAAEVSGQIFGYAARLVRIEGYFQQIGFGIGARDDARER